MIQGVEAFQRELRRLRDALAGAPEMAMERLATTVEQVLMLLATYAAEYPAKPGDSSYRRTGTLGRLWTQGRPRIVMSGHVLDARIENATPYGSCVQDPERQARMHRGLWQTTDDVVEQHAREIDPLLASAGYEIVEGIANAV